MAKELSKRYPEEKLKKFIRYHRRNPKVYQEFRKLAFRMRATGRKKYSARTIVEVLRWRFDLKTHSDDFKINDHYSPIYVRILIYKHPAFKDFFELR